MLGAIAGDIIGSIYEFRNHRSTEFMLLNPRCFFTDDTVMTLAVADVLHSGHAGDHKSYIASFHKWFDQYPNSGYGGNFLIWCTTHRTEPYNSFGNGSAMRVSPVAYAFDRLEDVLAEAKVSAEVTHNHPEGVRGAQATAGAVFLARKGATKDTIRDWVCETIGYDLSFTLDEIRPNYEFNETCQRTVPQAIVAFLESTSFEDALRKAISIGGDSDTLACITGSIAEPFYGGVPDAIADFARRRLDSRMLNVLDSFDTGI